MALARRRIRWRQAGPGGRGPQAQGPFWVRRVVPGNRGKTPLQAVAFGTARLVRRLFWIGNFDFEKAARDRQIDRIDDTLDMWPHVRPLLLTEHDDGNFSI